MISHEGLFHPVGFGLFHTAKISGDKAKSYSYVYDCGSKPVANINKCIKATHFEAKLPHDIDLLVVSHLHYDHVSGLPELLKKHRVKRIILPYLYPLERLILAIAEGADSSNTWYSQFLIDPAEYLRNQDRIDLIDFVVGEEWPDEESTHTEGEDKIIRTNAINEDIPVSDSRLRYLSDRTVVCVPNSSWEFHFFQKARVPNTVQKFQTDFNTLKGTRRLSDLLRDVSAHNKIRDVYRNNFGKSGDALNDTSLAMFSGTRRPCYPWPDLWRCRYYECPHHNPCYSFSHRGLYGILFTGDLSVKDVWVELANKFKLHENTACIYQVPHHGSKENWHTDQAQIGCAPVYVIASKPNDPKHPASSVISDIYNNGRCCRLVLDHAPSELQYRIHAY